LGPESIESLPIWTNWQALSFFGPLDALGKDGALSNKGPLGNAELVWDLVKRPGGIIIDRQTKKRVGAIPAPINYQGVERMESLFERFDQHTAQRLSAATLSDLSTIKVHGEAIDLGKNNFLGTSFMIEDAALRKVLNPGGQPRMTELPLFIKAGDKPELVSFFVTPERQADLPLHNLGLEIRYKDQAGKEHARVMSFRSHINMQKYYLPPHSIVQLRVFSLIRPQGLAKLPPRYAQKFRLFVTANQSFSKETLSAAVGF
jgi:hypothetical protein